MQLRAPALEYEPPGHASQLEAAAAAEYLPASQSVQAEARVLELVPAEQREQLTASPSL